jgi:hypothetical protein
MGTQLVGWLEIARPARAVHDPVFARIAVFEQGGVRVAFVALDLLSIRGSDVVDIRNRLEKAARIPAGNIMVAATHNHAGPAIVRLGTFGRDEGYLADLKEKLTLLAEEAVGRLADARLGIGVGFEGRISFNRRWVMRDGTAMSAPGVANPEALYNEGPIDPQLGVVAVRREDGGTMGYLVNWACHPVDVYDLHTVTASWPGALAAEVRKREDCPCLVLNGAFANINQVNWFDPKYEQDHEHMGAVLADDLSEVVAAMTFENNARFAVTSHLLELPLRDISDDEIVRARRTLAGEDVTQPPGIQRYANDEAYSGSILRLVERKKKRDFSRAEVQVIRLGSAAFVGLPAEPFVETGMKIKLESPFDPTFVVGAANGMVGYAPPPEHHARGGYECTTAYWSKVAPSAAGIMAETGIELARGMYDG